MSVPEASRPGTARKLTPFQERVYRVVASIPAGRVMTYAGLARAIGSRGYRAVGLALRMNPFAPQVPCHRVIRSDLTPGGFQGQTRGPALERKLCLLHQEGVVFVQGRLRDPERVWSPEPV